MFMNSFKYYKARNPPPDLENVLDFNKIDSFESKIRRLPVLDPTISPIFGLASRDKWEAFELIDHPGLIFLKNPFTSDGAVYWIERCLEDYTKVPHKTNVRVPEDKWWKNKMFLKKLRWVTLGYHHNWDTKIYSENEKSNFPKDLAQLNGYIAEAFGFKFEAQAAIINFYHMDSTLSGHTDHSEPNLEAPLLSFSFGQTAIFLIGGPSKSDHTSAMYLRDGDIVIMSGPSRICYHAVPKIIYSDRTFTPEYLNNARINMNVRQVLKKDQKSL